MKNDENLINVGPGRGPNKRRGVTEVERINKRRGLRKVEGINIRKKSLC